MKDTDFVGTHVCKHKITSSLASLTATEKHKFIAKLIKKLEGSEKARAQEVLGRFRAFVAARRLFGFAGLWQAIDTAAVPATAANALHRAAQGVLRAQMADLVRLGLSSLSRREAHVEPTLRAVHAALVAMNGGDWNDESPATAMREVSARNAPPETCTQVVASTQSSTATGARCSGAMR